MPNRRCPGQFLFEHSRTKNLADQPHAIVALKSRAVGNDNPRRLLAAVLLREESLINDLRGLRRAPDAE